MNDLEWQVKFLNYHSMEVHRNYKETGSDLHS